MPSPEDIKKELDKTQAEFDQSLQQTQESFNELKRCVYQSSLGSRNRCLESEGSFGLFKNAAIKSAVLEQERDRLASQVPEDLVTLKSMHANCMQSASWIKDTNELVRKKGNIHSWFFYTPIDDTDQLRKCATLQRRHDKLEEKLGLKKQ